MGKDFTVTVREGTERGDTFKSVLGTRTVHVQSPIPRWANLPEVGERLVYMLDLNLITPEQRQALIAHVSKRFGVPPDTVDQELNWYGIPILADDCVATISNPSRWF